MLLRLIGTAERRDHGSREIRALSRRVSYDALAARLDEQKVLALAGTRLLELVPDAVPESFRTATKESARASRLRGALLAHFTAGCCKSLEDAGVPTLTLKGSALAERIHGDVGMRAPSRDVDLLVDRADFDHAAAVLELEGYRRADRVAWVDRLPHYHVAFLPTRPYAPLVELHWRVHWYESEYATRVLERSEPDELKGRQAALADDLALLLLIYARDGMTGARFLADIAAWWDKYGPDVEPLALDPICDRHPRLEQSVLAAATVAADLVGLPIEQLTSRRELAPRARMATRLADWSHVGNLDDGAAETITFIDLLLTPPSGAAGFIRHYWLQPIETYVEQYGWDPDARVLNQMRRLAHVLTRMSRWSVAYAARAWQVRGNRMVAPLPWRRVRQ